MRHLIAKYHPSVRAALKRWMDDVESYSFSSKLHKQQTLEIRRRLVENYPAYAVARAYSVAHPRSIDLCSIGAPLEKIAKSSRIGIGPEVPAERIRVRMGRKYAVVYVAKDEVSPSTQEAGHA